MSQVVMRDAEESPAVQFYESDTQLIDTLCTLIAGCFGSGGCAIVIATPSRRHDIEKSLTARGFDVSAARARHQYLVLDAAHVLSRIHVNAQPDRARFNTIIRGLAADVSPECRRVWVYDETVTMLWAQRMREAALQLEGMWNDFARTRGFSLHRAYPLRGFSGHTHEQQQKQVCAQHTRFIPPPEGSALAGSLHRLRVIDQLRQNVMLRRERESRAFDLVGHANGRYWLGLDGTILWANGTELNQLGYAHDEYIGRHISEFHAEPGVADDILGRLRSSKALYDYPARRLCKNGSVISTFMYSTGLWKWEKFTYISCLTRMESGSSVS